MRWKDEIGIAKICCGSIQCNCKWRYSNIKPPPKKSCLCTYCVEIACQTILGPEWEFLHATLFGFCISPFLGHSSEARLYPLTAGGDFHKGLNLVRRRQDLLGLRLSFKLSFPHLLSRFDVWALLIIFLPQSAFSTAWVPLLYVKGSGSPAGSASGKHPG